MMKRSRRAGGTSKETFMKRTPKKLTLTRETLQQLQGEDLVVVKGGVRTDDFTTCAVGTCCARSSCYC
jgi:hypothetical protein